MPLCHAFQLDKHVKLPFYPSQSHIVTPFQIVQSICGLPLSQMFLDFIIILSLLMTLLIMFGYFLYVLSNMFT